MIVATKVGADMGEGRTMAPVYVRKAVRNSLRRLQTDRVDLYQTHWDDAKTPLEDVLSTYADLIKAGKVRGNRRIELFRRAAQGSARCQRESWAAAL